jgi:hypothetical protein
LIYHARQILVHTSTAHLRTRWFLCCIHRAPTHQVVSMLYRKARQNGFVVPVKDRHGIPLVTRAPLTSPLHAAPPPPPPLSPPPLPPPPSLFSLFFRSERRQIRGCDSHRAHARLLH